MDARSLAPLSASGLRVSRWMQQPLMCNRRDKGAVKEEGHQISYSSYKRRHLGLQAQSQGTNGLSPLLLLLRLTHLQNLTAANDPVLARRLSFLRHLRGPDRSPGDGVNVLTQRVPH